MCVYWKMYACYPYTHFVTTLWKLSIPDFSCPEMILPCPPIAHNLPWPNSALESQSFLEGCGSGSGVASRSIFWYKTFLASGRQFAGSWLLCASPLKEIRILTEKNTTTTKDSQPTTTSIHKFDCNLADTMRNYLLGSHPSFSDRLTHPPTHPPPHSW